MGSPAESGWADAIVAQHYQGLYRYAYRLSGSATEAEDLTQETFVRAFSHRRQLRHVERVRPWLYSILRNEYLRRCRQQQQRGPTISLDDTDDLAERLPAPPTNIDAELLQQALLQLPEEFRTPLILLYWEDFQYQEIAELMNIPMGTVMSRIWRAKRWLKRYLTSKSSTGLAAGDGRPEAFSDRLPSSVSNPERVGLAEDRTVYGQRRGENVM
jgi:RNA polymerase sigma-70 factor (ECF subfamily)